MFAGDTIMKLNFRNESYRVGANLIRSVCVSIYMMSALQGCLGEIEGNTRSQSVMFGGHDICTVGGLDSASKGIGSKYASVGLGRPDLQGEKNNVSWAMEQLNLAKMSNSRCLHPPKGQAYVDTWQRKLDNEQRWYEEALARQRMANGVAFDGFLNGLAQGVAAYNSGYAPSGAYYGGSGYPGTTGGSGTGCGSECVVSDIRLKKNIRLVGRTPQGLTLYRFSYVPAAQIDGEFIGVMAQDLLASPFADAVYQADSGFLMVDYGRLPLEFIRLQ